jgi:hypothetical protein
VWFAFFEWCQKSALAVAILDTGWLMPLLNTMHEIGMALLLGSVLVTNLRMLGFIMTRRPVSEVAAELRPWIVIGLVIMMTTGLGLLLPEAVRWYRSDPFRVKMSFLLAALTFQFTIHRSVARDGSASLGMCRTAGALSLILWFGVGVGGRTLTFLGSE